MDYETWQLLESEQAASEAKLERDMRDLELLRKIRGHAHTAAIRALIEDDVETWSGWANAECESYQGEAEERVELLRDLIELLSPSTEKAGGT